MLYKLPYETAPIPPKAPERPYLEEHPLSQKLKPSSSLWAALLMLLMTAVSFWSWSHPESSLAASGETVLVQGEYWRIFVSPFLHADMVHLLANSLLFFVFGTLLRNYFGWMMFPAVSLMGAWATQSLAMLTYDPAVRLIGASGMVYFMAGLWLVLFARYADYLTLMQRAMRMLAFILVVLAPSTLEANVSYRSHAIGLAIGLLLGWLALPWTRPIPLTPEEALIGKARADARRRLLFEDEESLYQRPP